MTAYRAIFRANEQTLSALAQYWHELVVEPCDDADTFWIGGPPLDLATCSDNYRIGLAEFSERANCVIALSDAKLSAIQPLGSIEVINGDQRERICLVEPAHIEYIGMPIILSARGTTRPIRPMDVRAVELLAEDERFRKATTGFAACGLDMGELFKVVELIERAHGKLPPKRQTMKREAFFQRIEMSEDDWEALHRSFRPDRHAEPHDMGGRTMSPRLARILVQNALKLWLEREVPN